MKKLPFSTSSITIFLFFLLVAGVMCYRVALLASYVPFHHWDEAIYAQVTKEWVRNPSTVLTYNGQNWFEKPPLTTLLTAPAWIISPQKPEFYARFLSVVQSLGVLIFVYVLAHTITKKVMFSVLAVLVTVSSFLYQDRSSLLNVDITLTLGWLGYLWAAQKENTPLRLGSTLLGVLSKSFLGLIPLLVECIMDIVARTLTLKRFVQYVAILSISLVWHIFMIMFYGKPFIQSHFLDHMVSRVTRPIELHFGDKFFYVVKLWEETYLFNILAVFGIIIAVYLFVLSLIHREKRKNGMSEKSITIGALVFLGYLTLLTISKSKIHWYLTPLIPLSGLLAVYSIHWIIHKTKTTYLGRAVSVLMGLSVLFLASRFFTSAPVVQQDWYIPSIKTQIGKCVGKEKHTQDTVLYLVPPQERIDAHVIEAAQLQIGSSFIYGSAPAFLYYADTPVHFVYKTEDLPLAFTIKPTILVMDSSDLVEPNVSAFMSNRFPHLSMTPFCTADQMVAFRL